MKIITVIILTLITAGLAGQTRKELEDQRKQTLDEITYVDNMIKETEKAKTTGLNDLRIIGNRLTLRENVIKGYNSEIELLDERIELNSLAIDLMENDLKLLRADYARTIVNSYKSEKGNPEIAYILSARDFNQGYKRLKYLQQMTKFRRKEAEIIIELKVQIENTRSRLEEDLGNVNELKEKEDNQKRLLQQEQDRKRRMVNNLSSRERQLRLELEDKRRVAERIESEIAKLIAEESKRAAGNELTPEMKLISTNFLQNKGRLPWPVEKGVITTKFGESDHPVLSYVKENNPYIEITSMNKTPVRSVFDGEVSTIFTIRGENMIVIIKHGDFRTVYQNIVNVKVKKGDMVKTKQEIGEVYCDTENGSKSILKFSVFEGINQRDPEIWLAKRQ